MITLGAYAEDESKLPEYITIIHRYVGWNDDPESIANQPIPRNASLLLSFEPMTMDRVDEGPIGSAARGVFPPAWSRFLSRRHPRVPYLRFAHEMNGDWYPWSGDAGRYKRAFEKFSSRANERYQIIWCPNVDYPGAHPMDAFYPEDDAVDIIGVDGYSATYNEYPPSAIDVFGDTLDVLSLYKKPLWVCETAYGNGDKTAKMMFIKTLSDLHWDYAVDTILWFDANKEEDWRFTNNNHFVRAFRQTEKGL